MAQHQARLGGCNGARTGVPSGIPEGAMCVQRFDDSLNSAIHINYRISLRSSSLPEPRDPLLKVLLSFIFCSDFKIPRGFVRPAAGSPPANSIAGCRPGPKRCEFACASHDKGRVAGTRPRPSNDPSAGSPTETLLRLLLPLNDQV
jgi:hypothetical protein